MIHTDTVYFTVPATYFATAGSARQRTRHRGDRAGLLARAAARVLSPRLDRQLAAGCPATAGALLGAHAARLGSSAERHNLASSLRLMLCRALTPGHSSPSMQYARPAYALLQPNYAAIVAAQATVRRIIALLTDSNRPIKPRAIARLRILLCDGTGPLYQGSRESLVEELHVIISLM
ncbi:MAG: hypothetical protein AB7G47_06820 [Mycolicibacterium sp.]|uniref:hypothetical protein n=1 Tax=Mycolicibacterium sp. TaxID=2320850 RepID=UPI003D0B6583